MSAVASSPIDRNRLEARLARSEVRVGAVVLMGYALVSFAFFALPVLVRSGDRYAGGGADQRLFIWSLAWWPHAILHGLNPFYTDAMWAPVGFNLTWTTTVPGLALLFAPLTLLIGPIQSYNVAAVLIPALDAWCAYVLLRYLTRKLWPSVIGGYLFGFSTYVLYEESLGHVNLDAVFVLPLTSLVVLKFLDGRLEARGLVVRLAPLLAFQLLTSTEIAFTLTLALLAALALAFAFAKERRKRLRRLLVPLGCSYLFAALLTAPFLYYLLTGFERTGFWGRPQSADVANFLLPPDFSLIGGSWPLALHGFHALDAEEVFFGLPALIIAIWALWRVRNGFLVASFAVVLLAELGPRVNVYGHSILPAPWYLLRHAPVFDNVLPSRLAVYLALLFAVAVALWLARSTPSPATTILTVVAVMVVLPDPVWANWAVGYSIPRFFTSSAYRSCLDPGETILPLPTSYYTPVLWQAVSGFRFKLAAGPAAANIPTSYQQPAAIGYITDGGHLGPEQTGFVRTYVADKHVTSIVVSEDQAGFFRSALDQLAKPFDAGGVLVYHLSPTAPACVP